MSKIILGITGSIAAYKSQELLRLLVKEGNEVKVILTSSGETFVTPLMLKGLGAYKVYTEMSSMDDLAMSHIDLAKWADLVIIAPSSANFIAKLAHGFADDLLATTCITTTVPILVAPAMNKNMWENQLTQENISKLKLLSNVSIIEPECGMQACGDIGVGRMAEPLEIVSKINNFSSSSYQILAGIKILLTTGGTREPIDPVRFITNKSSGKMGCALANSAIALGAKVTLISANNTLLPQIGLNKLICVETAAEMLEMVENEIADTDIFISVAAVSDFKIANPSLHKIKKSSELLLKLVPNPDIIATVAKKYDVFCVGFAAETENVINYAQEKLIKKNIDMIIANNISSSDAGFESNYNEVFIISKNNTIKLEHDLKTNLSLKILDHIANAYYASLDK